MATSNQFPVDKPKKKTYGSLWYNGKRILKDRALPILNAKKSELLKTGYYKKELFKITY